MPQQPPAGWVNVPSGDSGTVGTCAGLLAGSTDASGDNTKTSLKNLTALLKATYNEPLKGGAALPLFYLYYCASQNLCVAFYKTIKRGAKPTSAGGAPTKRWWCISVGVAPTPASGWSYPYVKAICTYFYYNVVDPSVQDKLVTAEDHNRHPAPANYEVDACATQLASDGSVHKTPLSMQEPAYDPWKHLHPPKQIDFVQLTL